MEFAEALLALGVGGTAEWEALSPEGLKRAYLKKVRAHPPERDPQGFQRVREAYELLQATERAEPARTSAECAAPPARRELEKTERVTREPEPDLRATALDRLRQALRAKQYDAAADALLELYADATLKGPLPPPHVALLVITEQFSSGAQASGQRLFGAFEQHMARVNGPLGARLAVRWKLLSELVAFSSEAPAAVTRALAGAIESGNFQEATETLREELDERSWKRRMDLEHSLQKNAPTLYEAAWPRTPGVSRKTQRTEQTWALRMSFATLVLLSALAYVIFQRASSERVSHARAMASSSGIATHLDMLDTEQDNAMFWATRRLEGVLINERCSELPAAWAEYASVVRRLKEYESVMPRYEQHRARAISTCRLSASELPESP